MSYGKIWASTCILVIWLWAFTFRYIAWEATTWGAIALIGQLVVLGTATHMIWRGR